MALHRKKCRGGGTDISNVDVAAGGYVNALRNPKICKGCASSRLETVGRKISHMQCPEETARWKDTWWDPNGFAMGNVPKTCPRLALHDVTEALRQL